jgi:hypothetical protein
MNPSSDSFPPPVNRLFQLGDPREQTAERDYLALGLGAEHVPDLIRIAQDDSLSEADSDSPEVWAPMHAWRALGQLRAEPAIEPLLGLLHRFEEDDDDWLDELPHVFGEIGLAALAPLEAYAASGQNNMSARSLAASGLARIAEHYPETRDGAVAALTRLLENYLEPDRDPALNGFLISDLIDLKAVEAAPLIEQAFSASAVEETVAGDWDEVQVELGLKEAPAAVSQKDQAAILEAMRLLNKLDVLEPQPAVRPIAANKQAKAKPTQVEIVPPPSSGPKRKHHRRKK